jgi:catechol 2,3-dioxygenase-like lactoylglutathione lyase family enzyme
MTMRVLSLAWLGVRTNEYSATASFFTDVLGLGVNSSEADFLVLDVPGGATVEIFGPASPYNRHLTHPVAGFLVADLATAADELRAAGTEIVLPVQRGGTRSWLHFRAPDGFVYELVEDSHDLGGAEPPS